MKDYIIVYSIAFILTWVNYILLSNGKYSEYYLRYEYVKDTNIKIPILYIILYVILMFIPVFNIFVSATIFCIVITGFVVDDYNFRPKGLTLRFIKKMKRIGYIIENTSIIKLLFKEIEL
jgi:flagellar biosynthesis protein FlhB